LNPIGGAHQGGSIFSARDEFGKKKEKAADKRMIEIDSFTVYPPQNKGE
jgi:hypothetical protein